jgi:hypothetical protein
MPQFTEVSICIYVHTPNMYCVLWVKFSIGSLSIILSGRQTGGHGLCVRRTIFMLQILPEE